MALKSWTFRSAGEPTSIWATVLRSVPVLRNQTIRQRDYHHLNSALARQSDPNGLKKGYKPPNLGLILKTINVQLWVTAKILHLQKVFLKATLSNSLSAYIIFCYIMWWSKFWKHETSVNRAHKKVSFLLQVFKWHPIRMKCTIYAGLWIPVHNSSNGRSSYIKKEV